MLEIRKRVRECESQKVSERLFTLFYSMLKTIMGKGGRMWGGEGREAGVREQETCPGRSGGGWACSFLCLSGRVSVPLGREGGCCSW
jgi:hypothetical protein